MEIFRYCSNKKFSCNTFFIVKENKKAICIDPGDDCKDFIEFIDKNKLNVTSILLTHGHFDHIRGISNLLDKFGKIPLYINEFDSDLLFDDELNESIGYDFESFIHLDKNYENLILLSGDEQIDIDGFKIKCIYTPFHTKGSTCYYFKNENILFSGDTLFKNSVGRTDLRTSCERFMQNSLNKLKILPDNTRVLPGHEGETTIKNEKMYNFFLKN